MRRRQMDAGSGLISERRLELRGWTSGVRDEKNCRGPGGGHGKVLPGTGEVGYDGPTGLGTPAGTGAF